MPAAKGTPAFLIRLPSPEFEAAHEEAKARGVSLNELVRTLLRQTRRERLARRGLEADP